MRKVSAVGVTFFGVTLLVAAASVWRAAAQEKAKEEVEQFLKDFDAKAHESVEALVGLFDFPLRIAAYQPQKEEPELKTYNSKKELAEDIANPLDPDMLLKATEVHLASSQTASATLTWEDPREEVSSTLLLAKVKGTWKVFAAVLAAKQKP